MVSPWLIVLAVAIVLGVAFGAWLASRRRTSGRTGPFQGQDLTASAEPTAVAVEKDGGRTAPPASPMTMRVPTKFADGISADEERPRPGVFDEQEVDRPGPAPDVDRQVVEAGETQAVEDLAIREEGAEASQELTAADLGLQGDDRMDLNGNEAKDNDEFKQEKEPEHKGQTALPAEDSSTAKAATEQPGETGISQRVQDEVQQSSELPIGEDTADAELGGTDSETGSVSSWHDEPPGPSSNGLAGSVAAGETIGVPAQAEPLQTGEPQADETEGTQKSASESIEGEFAPPIVDNQQITQTGVLSTKEHFATGHAETKSEGARTAESRLPEDEASITELKTERQPDRSSGEDDEPVSAKQRPAMRKRLPPKYKPSIRTPETTKRTKRQQTDEIEGSGVRSLNMSVHVVFGLRNRCRVSLLPTRSGDLGEDVEVRGPNGQEMWSAYQDEWYSGIQPPNIGTLLKQGGIWEYPEAQTQWVLSGRKLYVLAPNPTISGFVSAPRLILGENHLVLCNKLQQGAVREALAEAGCSQPAIISEDHGVPADWVLFRSVRPTVPIQHDNESGIYNILRPLHDLEIVRWGGIRLSHSTWLNGHLPHLRIRGVSGDEPEVMIDGKPASADANGNYTASGWDKPGLHTVFSGGVTQSYEVRDGLQEWRMFDAFVYRPSCAETSKRSIMICGPLVVPNTGNVSASLTPSLNTCFLGAIPGQIAISPKPNDVRTPEFLAVADFPIVWTLPSNPLGSDRSLACVKLIRSQHVILEHKKAFRGNREAVLQWCYKILEASYKRLRIAPDTISRELWAEYKRAARGLRRQLR